MLVTISVAPLNKETTMKNGYTIDDIKTFDEMYIFDSDLNYILDLMNQAYARGFSDGLKYESLETLMKMAKDIYKVNDTK